VEKLKGLGFEAQLITNGVDTELFHQMDDARIRKELGIETDEFVIGFSGSVERWYAIDEMIRALPELLLHNNAIRLLIVGGSLFTGFRRELEKLAHDIGVSDNVLFTGTKPYQDLPQYIACMNVCTIPLSPPQWGAIALPNKFFEYSSCGKPILMRPIPDVTRIGGPNLFVYRTQAEYISHILSLMRNPVAFTINLEGYSWKGKARQFESLFHSLV
jgi:glycosyltransferase involved in cell wall biosynthesis